MNDINDTNNHNAQNTSNANSGPRISIDWAKDGLEYALKKGDIVVIVDTLRFSSAVVTAVAYGFTIYPVPDRHDIRCGRVTQFLTELGGLVDLVPTAPILA